MSAGQFDPRLTTYFGDATLQAGFLPLPNLFLRHYAELGLSGQQAMFVVQLMATTWDLGSPPATLSDIAGRMGIARRTAQAISAELHAKGVLEIYDQYDDGGSQIENGYDLGPLFLRLAAFAPAPLPSGTQRQRRARAEAPSEDATTMAAAVVVPLVAESSTPPWQESASPPGRKQHPSPDHQIQAPQQESARLKSELKTLRKNQLRRTKQQQQTPAAVAARQLGWIEREEPEKAGRSLRLDEPFSATEARRSRQILARIGLNADVADATATTLHPAECWALWLHACSSGLGPAWIAAQIYDRRRREPRMAGIPAPCMAAGRLLNGLPPDTAATMVGMLDSNTPEAVSAVQAALAADGHSGVADEVRRALEAVWSAAAATHRQDKVRGHPVLAAQLSDTHSTRDPRWDAARAVLQEKLLHQDYTTWIAPLVLLHAEEMLVVLGMPNCFVRAEIQNTYAAALQEALEQAWGQTVIVELVIDTPVSA
jgi:hypothetical protein